MQAGADLPAQPQELLLFLGGEGLVQAVLHLADAAADALVQLDGPGGQLQLFQAASRSTELRVISPFFSISCKMPVTVERRMENWAWMSR